MTQNAAEIFSKKQKELIANVLNQPKQGLRPLVRARLRRLEKRNPQHIELDRQAILWHWWIFQLKGDLIQAVQGIPLRVARTADYQAAQTSDAETKMDMTGSDTTSRIEIEDEDDKTGEVEKRKVHILQLLDDLVERTSRPEASLAEEAAIFSDIEQIMTDPNNRAQWMAAIREAVEAELERDQYETDRKARKARQQAGKERADQLRAKPLHVETQILARLGLLMPGLKTKYGLTASIEVDDQNLTVHRARTKSRDESNDIPIPVDRIRDDYTIEVNAAWWWDAWVNAINLAHKFKIAQKYKPGKGPVGRVTIKSAKSENQMISIVVTNPEEVKNQIQLACQQAADAHLKIPDRKADISALRILDMLAAKYEQFVGFLEQAKAFRKHRDSEARDRDRADIQTRFGS